ncbi:hypothetical protein NUW54_g4550 [Trametes sanguinea]|uniref:Uncharacterized protein n=1 Tax=Trametes sanguinea TaxID=158606 RepID=A0ACC1PXM3_9APHY|nr:hypothetical protein NUW54_g4550 [Trametes sanguinea]
MLDDSSDEELDNEYNHLALLALAGVLAEVQDARDRRAAVRLPNRRYLRRPQLLPNPRHSTPWQVLYNSQDDPRLCQRWESSPIPRTDTNPVGRPRLGRRSLTAEGALGLAYHYITSAMSDTALQQIFALVPATVTRYRAFALRILKETLQRLPEASIHWWRSEEECRQDMELIIVRHPLLRGAMGSIDGMNVLVAESDDPEIENATFNGWLHGHYTSLVLVFSPRGLLKACVFNAPGSWHDAKVARPIYQKLRTKTPAGYYLVADTAFPRGTESIAGRIQAPLKANDALPIDPIEREDLLNRNRQLVSFRQTAEWGVRQLRAGFARLRLPLDINDPVGRGDLLEVCLRSMNLRTARVGVSQIRTVYMRLWEEVEDADVWQDFQNVLFGEIRRRDRVARFYEVRVNNV